MADKKISELTSITGSATAADDYFVVVDTSGAVTYKISREELNNAIEQDVLSTVDINGGTIDGTIIGSTTPAAGDFTTIDTTGDVTVGGNLNVQGTTVTIDSASVQTIDLGDNDKIRLGNSDDLQIYHSGTNSFITEQGTGSLYISATNLNLRSTALETYLTAVDNGAVTLYHDNAAKIATTAIGVDVTGGLNTTGNVGIGTSPDKSLHVLGSEADPLKVQRSTAGNTAIQVTDGTNTTYFGMPNGGGFAIDNDASLAAAPWLKVDTSGIVDILSGTIELNGNQITGIQVTIADNAFATITPTGRYGGFISIVAQGDNTFPQYPQSAFLFADFGNTPFNALINNGSNFQSSTSGAPTGTTGTDGKVTIFTGGTSGTFYLENRQGSSQTFQITLM